MNQEHAKDAPILRFASPRLPLRASVLPGLPESHGVRSQCQDLIDAVYECRNPNLATLQRKPTKAAAAAATASATASTPTPAV